MRAFVFLLVLANLLFFAWTRDYLGMSRDPGAFRASEQLYPDRIRIISSDEPPPEIPREDKSAKVLEQQQPQPRTEICSLIVDIPAADAEAAGRALGELLPEFKVVHTRVPGSSSYWVHIPPLKNKREADGKVAELKKLGIKDFFVMQDNGASNLAISLGLYSTESAAESALEALKAQGVRSARMSERPGKPALAQIELRGPESQAAQMRDAIAQTLPQAKPGECGLRNADQ